MFNIRKSQIEVDPELFKKIHGEIWEFRTLYQGFHYRMLAFWDKEDKDRVLEITSHGFLKKSSKVPEREIERSLRLRSKYFENKAKLKRQ